MLANRSKIIYFGILIYLYLFFTFASFLLLSTGKGKQKDSIATKKPAPMPVKIPSSEEEFDPSKPYNVVLIGYGGAGHSGGSLADGLLVVHINPESKKVVLISIPRDLWAELPIRSDLKENHKINEAFAIGSDDNKYGLKEPQYRGDHGGGEMTKYAVSRVIGMPVSYYVSVDFDRLKKLIDTLDGIDVDVPVTFDDHFYPVKGLEAEACGKTPEEIAKLTQELSGFILEKQFECRYEHIHFDEGITHMDGETALKFVRSRHSVQHGGDFARHVRQQAVLVGIKDKILSLYGVSKATTLYQDLINMVGTDIEKEVLVNILSIDPKPSEYVVSKATLSESDLVIASKSATGQYILIPKDGVGEWGRVQNFISEKIQ
jgi:anionic cell wall polymer biosynthesis LytR-Cps2A-Psr (LCP) family protein